VGNAYKPKMHNGQRGIPFSPIMRVDLGAPTAPGNTVIVNAQAVADTNPVTQAATATGATYGRALRYISSNAGDTTQTITARGIDSAGEAVTETATLNGTNAVNGKKAFVTVTSVRASAALAGNLSVGTLDVLGLPYRCNGKYDIFAVYADTTEEVATATVVAADTATPTATTGDVRGTIDPNTAANGTIQFRVWMAAASLVNTEGSYGKTQYSA
jgi:hypothetical protein